MTVIQAALRVYKDAAERDRSLWLLYFAAVPPSQGLPRAGTRGGCSVPGIPFARSATFRPGTDVIEGRADERHPADDQHQDGGDAVHAGSIDRLPDGPEQADRT